MSDGWPGSFSAEGEYFGFDNADADLFFGTENWDQTTHQIITSAGLQGEIIVWKDNTNCQMSCGRWNPASARAAGDWTTGMTISLRKKISSLIQRSRQLNSNNKADIRVLNG